jgi:hypothetical protein
LYHNAEPLLAWLKRQRRTNEVEMGLMAHRFDLDGALSAGQWELAWRTREVILVAGIELYLRTWGLDPHIGPQHVDRARAVLHHLEQIDGDLADEAWRLLLEDAPIDEAPLRRHVAAVDHFLQTRLSVRSARSRGDAIEVWADGVRVLREVGQHLGVAGSAHWYLSETADPAAGLDWYDEVIRQATLQGGADRRRVR